MIKELTSKTVTEEKANRIRTTSMQSKENTHCVKRAVIH